MTKLLKKFFSIAISFGLILFISTITYAQITPSSTDTYSEIEVLENGDYIITTISEDNSDQSTRSSDTKTKTGSKTVEYLNSNNEVCWSFKVTGTFSYNGSSSSCTKVTSSYSINKSAWKNPSTSTSKSGNTATGSITISQYRLGFVVTTITRTISLSCNKNGTLS